MARGRKKSSTDESPAEAPPASSSRRSSRAAKKVSYSESDDFEAIQKGLILIKIKL